VTGGDDDAGDDGDDDDDDDGGGGGGGGGGGNVVVVVVDDDDDDDELVYATGGVQILTGCHFTFFEAILLFTGAADFAVMGGKDEYNTKTCRVVQWHVYGTETPSIHTEPRRGGGG
jgi:hypothetical protein